MKPSTKRQAPTGRLQETGSGMRIDAASIVSHASAQHDWHAWVLVAGVSVLLLAVLTLLPLREQHVALAVGADDTTSEASDAPHLYGFYTAETADAATYRWTQAWARISVPYGARLGEAVRVQLRLCGCRPQGTQPVAQLEVDNHSIAALPTAGHYRRYDLLLRSAADNPISSLYLVLHTPTISLDARPVGVRFARLDVSGVSARALPNAHLLALTLFGTCVALLVTRVSRDWLTRWLLLVFLVGGPALALLVYQRQELTADALVLAELCGVLLVALARPPRLIACALAALLLALPFAPQLLGGWLVDDAFISFRYAQNLLAGHGLVFNPGERVEGYTNFLWTIIAATILWLGGDPAQVTRLLTLIIGQTIIIVSYLVGSGYQEPRTKNQEPADPQRLWLSLVAPTLVATSAPFLLYTARGSGMETALFTLLVLCSLLLLRDDQSGVQGPGSGARSLWFSAQGPVLSAQSSVLLSGALLGLAAMTRPEGVMVAGIIGFYLLWQANDERRAIIVSHPASRFPRRALTFALGFLIFFGPYYLWRYSYYGLPLPNTFYVKVGASEAQVWRGIGYVAEYWRAEGLAWLVGLIVVAGVWIVRRKYQASSIKNQQSAHPLTRSPIPLVALVYTLYIVAVGGDWLPEWRFVVPLVPLYALLAQWGLRWLAARGRWGTLGAAALLVLALVDHTCHTLATRADLPDSQIGQENVTVMRRREVGLWLRDHTPLDTLVAVEAAGALPYYSQRPALDILGLNDRHIASVDVPTLGLGKPGHEKTDIPYIMDRQPTIIPYFSVPYLKTDPRFKQYVREQHEGSEGHDIILYRRPQ